MELIDVDRTINDEVSEEESVKEDNSDVLGSNIDDNNISDEIKSSVDVIDVRRHCVSWCCGYFLPGSF